MRVTETSIPGLKIVEPTVFRDPRGAFAETWSRMKFAAIGIDADFVQDNHAISDQAGTLRGLHFQIPPHAQGKLVRVIAGEILDVSVDLRRSSPTYGRHFATRLSTRNMHELWIPAGLAHGYLTLAPDTEVLYKTTAYYAPDHERGLRWDDPALGIDWHKSVDQVVVNERDRAWPILADLPAYFM